MALTVTSFIPISNEIEGPKEIMPKINHEWVDKIFILDGTMEEFLKGHTMIENNRYGNV